MLPRIVLFASLMLAPWVLAQDQKPAAAPSDQPAMNKPEFCATCHGADGNSAAGTFPNLAGQTPRYLYLQLKDFKEGRRKDPVMSPVAEKLEKADMLALAQFFSEQKSKPVAFKSDNAKVSAGKKIADTALCPMCHLGGFSGQNEIPRVAGQHPEYVIKQLKDFRAKNRTNDAGNMTAYAGKLTDEEIESLAHYIATLN
jgi:cytochrome c553